MNWRDVKDGVNKTVIFLFAFVGILVVVGLFVFIIKESIPALTQVGKEIFF